MSQFSWVLVFKAISTWLIDYEDRQLELISILKEIGIDKGLEDEDANGEKVPLTNIDPFSFFSLFMKYGIDRRKELFAALIQLCNLPVTPPTDFDGVPSAQALKVWLFPFKKDRTTDMIDNLWAMFHRAREGTLNDELFTQTLAIPNTGFAKLTQCLFYAFPDQYFPIDSQTRPWFEKNNIDIPQEIWTEYLNCLDTVRAQFRQPFAELSHEAWEANQSEGFSALAATIYLNQRFPDTCNEAQQIVAIHCANGRELAFDPGEVPAKKKKIKVFLSKRPDFADGIGKIAEFPPDKWRNRHLKQHAPSLAKGNHAWAVTVKSEMQLKQLCDWYSGEMEISEVPEETTTSESIMDNQPLNQILYGPPGTGKTFATIELAVKIADPVWYQSLLHESSSSDWGKQLKLRYDELENQNRIVFTTFHQSFSYEDFMEGIRATTDENTQQLTYPIVDGVFKELVINAKKSTGSGKQLGVSETPRIWKISIDRRGPSAIREYCFQNNQARIGWNDTGDLGNLIEEQTEEQNKYWRELSVTNQNTIMSFITEVVVGDVMLCLKDKSTIQAVGVVTSDYYFDESAALKNNNEMYAQVRDVDWLFTDMDLNILALNDNKHLVQKTLYPLDRTNWDSVLKLLNDTGHKLVTDSEEKPNYVMIIDEINRGNIARIFGELITLLEPSKRDGATDSRKAILPYSKEPFSIPSNLYVIGTMNTADRSLAQLDLALRRRFSFTEVPPSPELLESVEVYDIRMSDLLGTINQRIEVLLDRDHLIGHSYFLGLLQIENSTQREHELGRVFSQSILPLLQEYFFDDWERIGWVLNDPAKKRGDRFVQEGVDSTPGELFSKGIADQLTDRRYMINKNAFSNPQAFTEILSATNAVDEDT